MLAQAVKEAVGVIREAFARFLARRDRIARLKAELRTLGALDAIEQERLAKAVQTTGPVYHLETNRVLVAEESQDVKRTSVGVKELLEAIAREDSAIGARVQRVLDHLEAAKKIANAAAATAVVTLVVSEPDPGDLPGRKMMVIQ